MNDVLDDDSGNRTAAAIPNVQGKNLQTHRGLGLLVKIVIIQAVVVQIC